MIPDMNDMIKVLEGLEDAISESGWDQPPQLFVVIEVDREAGAYGCLMVPGIHEVHPHPPTALKELLLTAESPAFHEAIMGGSPQGGYCGVCFVVEAFTVREAADLKRSDYKRRLADDERSVEARMLYGVDLAGRLYTVSRYRGEEPPVESMIFRAGDSDAIPSGDMVESLIRFAKALARTEPRDMWDPKALNALLQKVKAVDAGRR